MNDSWFTCPCTRFWMVSSPTAEASVKAQEAAVRQANLDFEFTELKAPIAGRIGDRRVSAGNLVTVGTAGDSFFAPEVPVGMITRVQRTPGALTRTADVRPFADVTSLDIVGVVTKAPRTVKRGSLLPPSPMPSPSPN